MEMDTTPAHLCPYCSRRRLVPVRVVHSYDELEPLIHTATPAIVCGVVQGWPATTKWTPSYLLQRIGEDTPVTVRTDFSDYGNSTEWLGHNTTLPFKEFLAQWLQGGPKDGQEGLYLASLPLGKHFPELCEDVLVPPHPAEQKKTGNLWIGNRGQITPVHYDFSTGDPGMDGLHAVISGRKLFRLYDPAGNEQYFPRRQVWGRFHQAIVDPVTGLPDPAQYPQFANAHCLAVELGPGDMLFIPKLWWHHVTTLEDAVAVNFWFQHLQSEKLKLDRHWGHLEQYLEAVAHMEITEQKMRNVLQFYGYRGQKLEEELPICLSDPLHFMLLPEFIATFANGTRAPWVVNQPGAQELATALCAKVEQWVRSKIQERSHPSPS